MILRRRWVKEIYLNSIWKYICFYNVTSKLFPPHCCAAKTELPVFVTWVHLTRLTFNLYLGCETRRSRSGCLSVRHCVKVSKWMATQTPFHKWQCCTGGPQLVITQLNLARNWQKEKIDDANNHLPPAHVMHLDSGAFVALTFCTCKRRLKSTHHLSTWRIFSYTISVFFSFFQTQVRVQRVITSMMLQRFTSAPPHTLVDWRRETSSRGGPLPLIKLDSKRRDARDPLGRWLDLSLKKKKILKEAVGIIKSFNHPLIVRAATE